MRIPISIFDELNDDVIESTALLNLDSGEITEVKYHDYDVDKKGIPATRKDYAFTSGVLSKDGKDMEFVINVTKGEYSISATELEELKEKSVKLFTAKTAKKKRI